jgi:predicted transcriptional regulator of viral defense system
MAKPSSLIIAKKEILAVFSQATQKIYSKTQLASVLLQNRHSWHLTDTTNVNHFISFLTKNCDLRASKFRSETYKTEITRYSWGKASLLELAISIKPRTYLCHATAVMLHGLAKPNPKVIYLNVEQSPKPSNDGSLTQDGINRAFSGKQRQSNLIYMCNGVSVTMISGKNTNRLGVEEREGPASEPLQVTNLERTLIDIVVRPAYAGGASEVLNAYRAAKDRMSVNRLLAILNKLDYVYPYHQAIGFLMQKAGYPEKSCTKLRELGLSHDFYLAHALRQPEYSKDWRLFYPKGLS